MHRLATVHARENQPTTNDVTTQPISISTSFTKVMCQITLTSCFTSGRVENTVHPASLDRRRYKKRKPDARDSRLGNELASRSYRIAVIMALQLQRMTGRRRRTNRNKSTEQSTERHADSVASNSSWDNSFTSNQRCADCGLQLKIRSQFEDPQTFHTQLYSPKQRK